MPAGVASHFMDILAADQKAARSRVVLAAVLVLVFGALAWFLFPPWQGLATHAGAGLVGAGVGLLAARARSRTYEASVRGTWTQWMRFAVAGESVAEVHRKVRGRPGRNLPYVYAAILLVVWGLEAALLVLAFAESSSRGGPLAAPVIALNGLLDGLLLAYCARMARWYGAFRTSVSELVASGEIGVWGVM